uniref:Uncharacterized protein n=1 Tax=Lygus hesperus TaxID=30085 RepID=A0A0K8SW36_LYGHE
MYTGKTTINSKMSLPILLFRMGINKVRGKRVLALVLALVVLYALVFHTSEIELTDRAAQLKEMAKSIKSLNSHSDLWHGRQACRHPNFDVNSPEIMKFVKYEPPMDCKGEKDWVEIKGSRALITQEARRKHGDIECSFTDLIRTNDFATQVGLTTKTHTEYSLESSDFVRVDCVGESGKRWSNIMAGARYDQDIFDRTGWDTLPKGSTKMNVLMFGFDSISRLTFSRKLPKSFEYLTKELGTIILQGYNIVGDGTPQALIPILTGKTELELPDTRRRMGHKATFVNAYPFVWNEYKDAGYVTGYMEDTPSVGIFTYRLKGFDAQPTDHYMRPFYVDAESNYYDKFSKYCLGSVPRHKVMLDYMKHIFRVYKDRPKFVFGFHGEISHDDYNLVGAADDDLREWLEWFKTSGNWMTPSSSL